MAISEDRQANLGSPSLTAIAAALEALTGRRAAPDATAHEVTRVVVEEVRPRDGESWTSTRARALRLVIAMCGAASEAGAGAESADGAALRAARAVTVAAGANDLEAAVSSLIAELLRRPGEGDGWAAHLARRAADYIRRNYKSRLTLEEVARHAHLSPTYFCAVFKREWGIGFRRFLQEVRLAEARRLLEDAGRTIEDVANAVGFEDAHYFTRVFSHAMGVPPGEYRRRRQQEAYRGGANT